ncbi:MAG: UDP-N-acetylmuramoyl-L-alanine--D-glutamate ligase [Bacteriovoracaceae bacterium]|nr:UDP-N-acetylmuramoyl-L-alanine--D-glutamate ligase [Bacteriovoracaceae bacterium]
MQEMQLQDLKAKKVLIVGLGKTGFSLVNFFNSVHSEVRVTDIKPIFDLNKEVKKIKKIEPTPELTLGEHKDEDFLDADIVVYSLGVDPKLPQLELARSRGKKVFSEFSLAYALCPRPIIAVCGTFGRSITSHMISYALRQDGKQIFVGGSSEQPFIDLYLLPNLETLDYVIVEVSAEQAQSVPNFHPHVVVFTSIGEKYNETRFKSHNEYLDTKIKVLNNLDKNDFLIVNFDRLSAHPQLRNAPCQVYWYSRKSFATMGVMNEIQGTHFHERRIHSGVHCHSEFKVSKMRILGPQNRENLLAAITVCKVLKCSDTAIQKTIEAFPGIPHRLEFVAERNGVYFYNNSKCEVMKSLGEMLNSVAEPVILIAGGKDTGQDYSPYLEAFRKYVRVLILVGEAKENMNRALGDVCPTFLVGSFDESVLMAYQKSRTGDIVLLAPGNDSTDIFRDYEERGNYFKKLVFQI